MARKRLSSRLVVAEDVASAAAAAAEIAAVVRGRGRRPSAAEVLARQAVATERSTLAAFVRRPELPERR